MSPVTLKAHTQGSSEPILEKGVLRLYGMRFCPYVYRVRLVLAAKNIPYEIVNINLKTKPDWYLKKHPEGKVPLLEWDDKQVVESLIICDYLDEKYPERKLWPEDPYKKAIGKICIEIFSKIHGNLIKLVKLNDDSVFDEFVKDHENLERQLVSLKTDYFSGDKPGMADYMILPFVEIGRSFFANGFYKGEKDFASIRSCMPHVTAWKAKMTEDPLVKKCNVGQDNLNAFFLSYFNGTPDYDIGL